MNMSKNNNYQTLNEYSEFHDKMSASHKKSGRNASGRLIYMNLILLEEVCHAEIKLASVVLEII